MGPPNALKRFKALLDSRFKILRTLDLNLESTSHLDEHALKRFKAFWGAETGFKIPDLESWES